MDSHRLFCDNGGEFNNEEMRDMAEKFSVELKTTAAYSPWSNSLLERHNHTLTDILLKVKRENECGWAMARDWALIRIKINFQNQLYLTSIQEYKKFDSGCSSILVQL